MRRGVASILAAACLAALAAAGCAAPRGASAPQAGAESRSAVPSPPPPQAAEETPPPPAEETLAARAAAAARIEPLTRRLEAAPAAARPALLLERAEAAIGEAQRIWNGRRSWGLDPIVEEWFVAYYALVERDCREILATLPEPPEARRAQFTLGLIRDYPHLADFREAAREYLLTIRRYPGTVEAWDAETRLRLIWKNIRMQADALPAPR